MQDKFRLYRRKNGTFYAEEYGTARRESLGTKNEAEARRLIAAKNQAVSQPAFNIEMAKVYLRAHDPLLSERTWTTVSDVIQQTYQGSTKSRWETAEDIDWERRRLFYERQKLATRDQGRVCIAIGPRLEAILRQLPQEVFLFPQLLKLKEGWRSAVFWKRRRAAGIPPEICLHSYRYA